MARAQNLELFFDTVVLPQTTFTQAAGSPEVVLSGLSNLTQRSTIDHDITQSIECIEIALNDRVPLCLVQRDSPITSIKK
ncbi:MAG: hypothetical protein EBQ57_03330, partial [Actinobacteria bacterium]|nr:hypothetical protein [Actinomycetota bacterium]